MVQPFPQGPDFVNPECVSIPFRELGKSEFGERIRETWFDWGTRPQGKVNLGKWVSENLTLQM